MRSRCALLSVKWNSDDSATNNQCSAMLIRSEKVYNLVCFCLFVKQRLGPGRDKDIPGHRSSGKIRVASRRCTAAPVSPYGGEKKYGLPLFTFFRPPCPAFSFADVDTYGLVMCIIANN